MTELERALVALGHELELPRTPDLAGGIRTRIERRALRRRFALVAVAAAALAIGIAFAVPPARTAILRFFHLGAVTIERVETLPPARERPLASGLGPALSRRDAERVAGFSITLPHFKGAPPSRYYARPGLLATFLRDGNVPVLYAELQGETAGLFKKLASPATSIEPVRVGPYEGIWISGGPHVLYLPAGTPIQTRLAGDVLIWQRDGETFRLEGESSKSRSIRLAKLITP